ncbi:hypothetical protein GGS23DRAFT_562664 [Durotheca rogersii]|uniref:uncharacterized protein n=1 Tax=Durotheca rogersii TaxID=419775 RepID=UPI002220BB5E|nr:uncharacterized protein GGS23DRAFT_562664 [Durotheca rogersii]KAI5864036.1 hypothetical protein GGS23DRAFT_562664 [Durotheca rogersii]
MGDDNIWITTHGIGAIKDSEQSLTISMEDGSASARSPGGPKPTTAWFHFPIPSPPSDFLNLKAVKVDFNSTGANLGTVVVYAGSKTIFQRGGLSGQHVQLPFDETAVYDGLGICVSVLVTFLSSESSIKFQSVGIQAWRSDTVN